MLFLCANGLLGLLLAGWASASPAPVNPHLLAPLNDIVVRDPLEVARDPNIEKRISADFSLDREWHNQVLFEGAWSETGEHDAQSVSLSVVCRECWTRGTVTAKLTAQDIIKPVVRLDLGGVEAYVDLDVDVSANAVYAINLFTSNSPVGIGFPGLSVGLVFYVDLVFSASAVLDLEGGFYVSLAEDAFLETDVFSGDITDSLFDGIGTKSFPITVHTGSATFKAALRVRVQLGVETEVPLIGVSLGGGAVVGIYANIVEFVAQIEITPDCALEAREWFNLNVGAYARAGFDLDFTKIGVAPTVSTTLFDSPTFTQCLIDSAPVRSDIGAGNTWPATSVPAITTPAALPSLPVFGEPVPTHTDSASLVAVTTVGTPRLSSLVTQPHPTYTPSGDRGVPRGNSSVTSAEPELITTTIYPTTEYVITSCAASVINCPASWERTIVVTKTLDAYTTVCPAGASVTVPPQRETASIDEGEAPVVHVITEVFHLHKLKTPAVHTFHATEQEKDTEQRTIAPEISSRKSRVPDITTSSVESVIPLVSELPVAIKQEEDHLSHNATTPQVTKRPQTGESPAQTAAPGISGANQLGSRYVHLLATISVALLLV
ncbi:hypothetical protein LIA77_10152 [Sarocladium implicatum]|nr:hypothetical protein LIA77_10152 [Sarocladium implicatum]